MFAAGALPLAAVFVYAHILSLPHPDRFFALLSRGSGSEDCSILARIGAAQYRYTIFWGFAPLESVLLIAAAVAAAFRRTRADIHWLILLIATHIGYFFIGPIGEIHYDIYALPILAAGTGALFTYFIG